MGAIKGIIAIESRIPINGNMLKKGSSSPNESVEAKRLLKSMIPNNEIFLIIKYDLISIEDSDAFKAYQYHHKLVLMMATVLLTSALIGVSILLLSMDIILSNKKLKSLWGKPREYSLIERKNRNTNETQSIQLINS